MKRCVFCQAVLDPTAQVCRSCGQVQPSQKQEITFAPIGPGASDVFHAPSLPGTSAGPQAATPTLPSAPGGPQSAAPSISNAPAGPQSGAPGVPHAPAGPSSGVTRVASKAATQGLRRKLLGTAAGKAASAVLATVIIGTAVLAGIAAATGHDPLQAVLPPGSSEGHTPAPVAHLPELAYLGSDGNVWEVDVPAGHPKQLTSDADPQGGTIGYSALTWSPDGSRLAFFRVTGPSYPPQYTLLILSADGDVTLSLPLSISGFPINNTLAWSPNSQLLAYRTRTGQSLPPDDEEQQLVILDAHSGGVQKTLKYDGGLQGCGGGPAPLYYAVGGAHHAYDGIDTFVWSPDGNSVLVSVDCESDASARLDLSTGKLTPGYPKGARYQPSGNQIVGTWYAPRNEPNAHLELGLTDAAGAHTRTLLSEPPQSAGKGGTYEISLGLAVWSLDSQMLYYERDNSLWRMRLDGSGAQQIATGTSADSQGVETVEMAPALSPDGTYLLYLEVHGADFPPDATVTEQWYLAQPDGSHRMPLLQSEPGEAGTSVADPVWRP